MNIRLPKNARTDSGFNRFVGFAVPEFGFWGPDQLNTYNGRGEREHRYLSPGQICKGCPGEGHRLFGYDEHGRLLFDTEGDTPRHKILWLDDQPIALAVAHGAYAGEVLHIHADHLGSPRAITRPAAAKAVVWRWRLEGSTFGQHPADADPDGDGVSLEFNLRYPGQYFDSSTGWHYNYFRDYEPGTGRYLQSDPIGLRGGVSTFSYAESAPTQHTDQLGLRSSSGGPSPHPLTTGVREGLSNPFFYQRIRDPGPQPMPGINGSLRGNNRLHRLIHQCLDPISGRNECASNPGGEWRMLPRCKRGSYGCSNNKPLQCPSPEQESKNRLPAIHAPSAPPVEVGCACFEWEISWVYVH